MYAGGGMYTGSGKYNARKSVAKFLKRNRTMQTLYDSGVNMATQAAAQAAMSGDGTMAVPQWVVACT